MPTDTAITHFTPDSAFLIRLIIIVHIGLFLAIIGFIAAGVGAFWKNTHGAARVFVDLFLKGEILRLLTVAVIGAAVFILGFARIIDGPTTASILSGIAGYVLGGLGLSKVRPEAAAVDADQK